MRPFGHPTPRSFPRVGFALFRFLAARTNVRGVRERLGNLAHLIEGIAFVQAKMLPVIRTRLGPLDRDARQRFFGPLHVMPIRAGHGEDDWNARARTIARHARSLRSGSP